MISHRSYDRCNDDLALHANASAQAVSLPHSQEQVAGDIGLNLNINKTEYMYFKQKGAM